MSINTFLAFSGIFGFILSVISLLASVINICRSQLPSNKIKDLESLLDETETHFNKAVKRGHLKEQPFIRRTKCRLSRLRSKTYPLQSRAYRAAGNLGLEFTELFRGTSIKIGEACQVAKNTRAQIMKRCEKGRHRAAKRSVHLPIYWPAGEHHLNLATSPPARVTWKKADTRCAFTENGSFCDSAQSDADVRITDAYFNASIIHTSATLEPLA